ncbi:MAG: amidase [Chloroflexi bacterium]|nr:amidase [Chloroflexota bacterium]
MSRNPSTELHRLTLEQAADLLRRRAASPAELCEVARERLERFEPQLNAFITVTADVARAAARRAEQEIARGDYRGALHGVPLSLKDIIATRGIRTTRGARLYEEHVPDEDATVWSRLANAGAVLLGKNNCMEFAYGTSLVNERFGAVHNPWDLECTASGSSSGSAVAVAAGIGYASIGSETGASTQRPASFCGVVGMKATYGRVSRFGISPTAWSLDHVGTLTRSVRDAALVFQSVAGPDLRDPTTLDGPAPDWLSAIERGMHGLRLGIPRAHIAGQVDPDVEAAFWQAAEACEAAGATLVEIDPPELGYAAPTSVGMRMAESSAYHARTLRRHPEGYSAALRPHLEIGNHLTAGDYLQLQRARRAIDRAVSAAFREVDLLIWPTTPTAPTKIIDGVPAMKDRAWDIGPNHYHLVRLCSLLGLPAVSLPCGYTDAGLPLAIQFSGRRLDEATVLVAARDYERRASWLRPPPRFA